MTWHLSIALLLALSGAAAVPAADPRVQAIAPFVGEEVAAVVHLDLTKLDVVPLVRSLLAGFADAEEMVEAPRAVDRWLASLRLAGAKELFIVVDPADMPGPPIVVVPLVEGADAKAIGEVLCGGGKEKPLYTWPTCATVHRAVFAGTTVALERVRVQKTSTRPELAEALSAFSVPSAQILILPSANQRRIVDEMLPTMPQELGGGPITTLTRGMRWAAMALETHPKPALHLVVQSKDVAAAQGLIRLGQDGMTLIERSFRGQDPLAAIVRGLAQVKPAVVGDRIVLDVDLERATALVSVPLRAARAAAQRSQCVNNLKQIGLAMHNYHASHKTFPPAYSRDKSGRPLLSWRVHILPYLEQATLYKEFHLDEPWDSPHNRRLIDKMPELYRCPSLSRKAADRAKTTYLAPRGEATILHGAEGVKLNEITDGTSNTILVVAASDDLAVTWTEPKDWDVDPELVVKGLFGHHPDGTNFGFADGSVRFLKESIGLEVLKALLTRNGGEVLSANAL